MKFPKGITKCDAPKMQNSHRGRTWDHWPLYLPDGSKTKGYLDTSWGVCFYFVIDGVWRKGRIYDFDRNVGSYSWFDLRPTDQQPAPGQVDQ